jgi:hypothetical protein
LIDEFDGQKILSGVADEKLIAVTVRMKRQQASERRVEIDGRLELQTERQTEKLLYLSIEFRCENKLDTTSAESLAHLLLHLDGHRLSLLDAQKHELSKTFCSRLLRTVINSVKMEGYDGEMSYYGTKISKRDMCVAEMMSDNM